MKDKYLWYTDTHLDKVNPISKMRFVHYIRKENPKALFLTGDISNGLFTCLDLKVLATWVKCPIYFVLGNHDYHFSSINETHKKIKSLCQNYPNLRWLSQEDIISLSEEVALIGTEGWYDASMGNSSYLKLTPDWMLIEDFRKLNSMEERIQAFQNLADKSCQYIEQQLEKALADDYKTIYILTHFPPWKEATRDVGKFLEKFWLPYNVNYRLGQKIESIMSERKKRNVIVLAGHTHHDCWIHVSRNIECKVNEAKYYGTLRNEEHIFI
jgi:predicted MPP superfamily phosphohydrolase